LVHDVQETFGIRLAPVTLLAHPVLRDLAAVIDRLVAAVPQTLPSAAAGEVRRLPAPSVPSRQSPLESSPMVAPQPEKDPLLVQIAKGGSGAPFFWVHGVGGEVFSYMRVSRHLAEHRPVYGFAADWTVAFDESERRIDAIAAAYVSELRRIRPHGPYHLGGFCSAGTLVLEMVRQLEEAGETVGAFAILDFGVLPEEGAASGLRKAWAFMRNLPRWIQEDAVPSGAGELVGRVRSKMRRLFGSGNRANGNGHHVDIRDATGMWRFPDSQVEMLTLHHRVIHGYAPRPCDGRVTLFLPRTAPLFGPWPDGHDPGWSQLARGGVEVVSVAGSHSTMLTDPFAEGLAAQLEACVERAEGREGILEARSEPKKPLGLATSA
jgi:thioesterase domain-containing protein